MVRQSVLSRVAVIALGAMLLVLTAYLVVQVSAGPRVPAASAELATTRGASRGAAPTEAATETASAPGAGPSGATAGSGQVVSASSSVSGAASATPASPTATTPSDARLAYSEAYKLYDRREYEEARALALSLLRDDEWAVRMRRIVVASSCIMGDQEIAQQHYLFLPDKDRSDMRLRCTQYGGVFREQ